MTEDFGAYIRGSNKDMRCKSKNKSSFTKANVWERPDYQQLVDNGIPKHIVFWQKLMRDSVPAYKSVFGKEKFIELTSELKTEVEKVKTEEQLINFFETFFTSYGWIEKKGTKYYTTTKASIYLNNKIFRNAQINNDKSIAWLKSTMEQQNFLEKKEKTEELFTLMNEVENVSGDDLLKLNIRGGQFGSSVSQKERKYFINSTYQSLCNLSLVTGIPKEKIGLKNAIAFGARGRGRASAHYENDTFVINLTRNKGQGSFAHEWAHSLDNYIMHFCNKKGFASVHKDELATKLPAFYRLICEMQYHGGEETTFYKKSYEKDVIRNSAYYSDPEEMFARAFACYVKEKLEWQGILDEFLYGSCEEEPEYLPTYEEKRRLKFFFNDAFKELNEKIFY